MLYVIGILVIAAIVVVFFFNINAGLIMAFSTAALFTFIYMKHKKAVENCMRTFARQHGLKLHKRGYGYPHITGAYGGRDMEIRIDSDSPEMLPENYTLITILHGMKLPERKILSDTLYITAERDEYLFKLKHVIANYQELVDAADILVEHAIEFEKVWRR